MVRVHTIKVWSDVNNESSLGKTENLKRQTTKSQIFPEMMNLDSDLKCFFPGFVFFSIKRDVKCDKSSEKSKVF